MAALGTVQDKTTSIPSTVNSISDTTQPQSDKSAGSLVAGVSDLFEGAVKAGHDIFKKDIDTQLQTGYDQENDKNGVSNAALDARLGLKSPTARPDSEDPAYDPVTGQSAGDPLDAQASGQSLPAPAQGMIDRAGKIQQAGSIGRLTPTDYNAKMEALVRQVRAEYPQFRDEIDQKISQLTGMTPANALRASQLRDQNAALRANQSAQKQQETFINSNLQYLKPGWQNRTFDENRQDVYQAQAEEHKVSAGNAALSYKVAQGNATSADAVQTATGGLDAVSRPILDKYNNPDNKPIDQLQQEFAKMTVDQKNQMRDKLGMMYVEAGQAFDKHMASSPDDIPGQAPSGGKSFAQLVGPSNVASMKQNFLKPFQDHEKLLTDGNFGILSQNKNANQQGLDSVQGNLQKNAWFTNFAVVRDKLGDTAAGVLLTQKDEKGQTPLVPIVKLIRDNSILGAAVPPPGGGPPAGPQKAANAVKAALEEKPTGDPEVTAKQYRGIINGFTTAVTNEKADAGARYNIARSIVHDAAFFAHTFTPGSGQTEAYSLMTTPAMTDSMYKMKAEHPDIWQGWVKYTQDNFIGVNRMGVSTLQDLTTDRNVKVSQDPKTGLFSVDHADSSPYKKGNADGTRRADGDAMLASYQARIDGFNKSLSNLSYMLGKDGRETGPELIKMAHDLGVDVNAPKDDFWGKLVTATKSGLVSAGKFTDDAAYDEALGRMADPVIGKRASSDPADHK
ncbi:hypothetical protein [Bradyrhizobium erythrophlei]|uniref:Uncharacterized protein n=1 Tax=Bradyrhizobium erythrophlei TaxID=1437360 RepID=A0A1M5T7C3_9BRAD|nr:hypothetical protein [Bradyrhizobium erythrophlei]SHH46616.1 hypothetical protein SAMN05444169_7596 [Bradyrhizobium erythrophlei]